jgi:hypothetical protein
MWVHRVGASAPRDRRRVAPHKPWRERRWPSFIIWRWAGPAQDGWIHCLRRALLRIPRTPVHSTSRSPHPASQKPPPPHPAGNLPGNRGLVAPRRQPRNPPGRQQDRAEAPLGRPPARVGPLRARVAEPPRRRHARVARAPGVRHARPRERAARLPERLDDRLGVRRGRALEKGGGRPGVLSRTAAEDGPSLSPGRPIGPGRRRSL